MIFSQHLSEADVKNYIADTQAFFIDFDGTLVDYKASEIKALNLLFTESGLSPSIIPQAIERYGIVNTQLWEKFEQDLIGLDEIKYQRFNTMINEFKLGGEANELNSRYLDKFIESVEVIPEALTGLSKLKNQFPDIPRIIVTNGIDYVQKARIEKIDLQPLISGLVTSDGIGSSKPSPEIFYAAQRISGKPLENTWMIGDSLSSDIQGSKNAGTLSCLISSSSIIDFSPSPDIIVNSFAQFCREFINLRIK